MLLQLRAIYNYFQPVCNLACQLITEFMKSVYKLGNRKAKYSRGLILMRQEIKMPEDNLWLYSGAHSWRLKGTVIFQGAKMMFCIEQGSTSHKIYGAFWNLRLIVATIDQSLFYKLQMLFKSLFPNSLLTS